jgi:hypothetical protein
VRHQDLHESYLLQSDSVKFVIVSTGMAARQTLGQSVRRAGTKYPPAGPEVESVIARDPTVVGGTSDERTATILAHRLTQSSSETCATRLRQNAASALYADWFGAFDQGRYSTVTRVYDHVGQHLALNAVVYDQSGTGPKACQPGLAAYTYHGIYTIWLCSKFAASPLEGFDTKQGFLVHEWTHALETVVDRDIAYGQGPCLAFSRT